MKIRHIHLENFRCFDSADFDFNGNLTVVVGNNTTGKTSLLRAVRISMGAYLSSLPTLASGNQYRCNFTKNDRRQRFDEGNRDYEESENPPLIITTALFPFPNKKGSKSIYEEQIIEWQRELTKANNTTHSPKCAGQLIDAATLIERTRKAPDANAIFPLVLSFSSKRINAQSRQSGKVNERLKRIDKAYRAALSNDVDFENAMDWLNQYEKRLKDGQDFEGNKEALLNAISEAIPMLSEVTLHSGQLEAVAETNGKKERHHYDYMSDGFKAMVSLVTEIAYRAIMLNGFLGQDAVHKTPGIVLIDEIDLYLHPLWQQRVLSDLQKAFPNIQFIVTTHSPFIIQSVRKENLLILDDVELTDDEPNMKSIEDIAEEEMNMREMTRSRAYNEMLKAADEFFHIVTACQGKSDDEIEQMRQQLTLLQARVGNDPVYRALMEEKLEANGLKASEEDETD